VDPNEKKIFLQLSKSRWIFRRRITCIAFIFYILICLAFVFHLSVEKIEALDSFFTSVSAFVTSIVLGYFGFATLDTKWGEHDKDKGNQ
jgi:succinate dehydrogenase hydrophobic anchor subunit